MNKRWLFLRGSVPKDRDPKEIEHETLEQEDDMWIHLFAGLVGCEDEGHVIYYNALEVKCFRYRDNFHVWHYPNLDPIMGEWDYVFARGGFPIYDKLLERIGGYKIYYGAGKRFYPKTSGYCKYDLILIDSDRQKRDVLSIYPYIRCEKIIKPAAPLFYPRNVKKEFDCCFVAGVPNPCKMVQWVYDTCPRDISILQLGYTPDKYPENVTVKRVPRWDMPDEMCRCRVGIVPYSSNDSCPRVIPEFMACGIEPVVCKEVNFSVEMLGHCGYNRDMLWKKVRTRLCYSDKNEAKYSNFLLKHYERTQSLPVAVNHLKKIIGGIV